MLLQPSLTPSLPLFLPSWQEGASHLFPDRWDAYVAPIPEAERHDLITAYRKRLVGTDDEVRSLCVGRY